VFVDKVCVDKVLEEGGGGEGGGGARDTESKTRTPHKDVGNNNQITWHNGTTILLNCQTMKL